MPALTLRCICVPLCTLTALEFHLSVANIPDAGGYGFGSGIHLVSPGFGMTVGVDQSFPSGSYVFNLFPNAANWLADWPNIYIDAIIAGSLFQPTQHFPGQILSGSWYIKSVFTCFDPLTGLPLLPKTLFSINTQSATNDCITAPGDPRSFCTGGPGSAVVQEFKSTPLGACNGCDIHLGNFLPDPNQGPILPPQCLCAAGGTPPYTFSIIAGQLPCGESLGPSSGCITGTPDNTCPGTPTVTFQVMDSLGATATITCNPQSIQCGPAATIGNSFY